jgi:uncharacterized membrane protein
MRRNVRRFIKYFLQGVVVLAPVAVTVYLLVKVFVFMDSLNPFNVPGVGLVLTCLAIALVGFIVRNYISDRIIEWFERQIKKAPLVSIIYTAVQDLLKSFVGDRQSFKQPVIVKLYENSEIRRLGFITNDNFTKMPELGQEYITVYCPHSYNISGNVFLVPASYVKPVNLNPSDVMKYTVSGGVTQIEKAKDV